MEFPSEGHIRRSIFSICFLLRLLEEDTVSSEAIEILDTAAYILHICISRVLSNGVLGIRSCSAGKF